MQTFITRTTWGGTAGDLDNVRLFNQMNECSLIFDHLTGVRPDFYPNHPVMYMWRGYEYALAIYAMMLGMEWNAKRGFAHAEKFWWFSRNMQQMRKEDPEFAYEEPPWLKDPAVILSHRSNLVRKDRALYQGQWKQAPKNWPYIWPVVDLDGGYELKFSRADKLRLHSGERAMPEDDVLKEVANWP